MAAHDLSMPFEGSGTRPVGLGSGVDLHSAKSMSDQPNYLDSLQISSAESSSPSHSLQLERQT